MIVLQAGVSGAVPLPVVPSGEALPAGAPPSGVVALLAEVPPGVVAEEAHHAEAGEEAADEFVRE